MVHLVLKEMTPRACSRPFPPLPASQGLAREQALTGGRKGAPVMPPARCRILSAHLGSRGCRASPRRPGPRPEAKRLSKEWRWSSGSAEVRRLLVEMLSEMEKRLEPSGEERAE